ncbi:MAG: molybdopterin molybdenumtransferase MoeA [Alphaproteobacteria bacterium]|nr:MAG: molybdopterin molybdenumtransferase MoeA [Alphaproteobacteria bacterium]
MPDCCAAKGTMVSYDRALSLLLAEARPRSPVQMPLGAAVGHVLAWTMRAPISVPSFDNSAMDGFAFSAASVAAATADHPVHLPVSGASIAGDAADLPHLYPGTAVKIMTGAPLPEGADTVLPVEMASWDESALTFQAPWPAHQHVRRTGQDVGAGDRLMPTGTRLSAAHVPLLSAVGLGRVPVYPNPRACWISTGQEICDDFGSALPSGHIYNATRLFGERHLPELGVDLAGEMTVRDTPQDFSAALEAALEAGPDIILSTGGVSAGQYDFVRPVLEDFGAHIVFHKVRIKPAKPVLFAILPDGRYFFGLPGNPISTALALRAFVYPFVRALTGEDTEPVYRARLGAACAGQAQKTSFLMASLVVGETGMLEIIPQASQQSFQTRPFAASNAWIVLPEGTGDLPVGSLVDWLPLRPGLV